MVGPVRILPSCGTGDSDQPYAVKQILRHIRGVEARRGVTDQPCCEFGAQRVCVLPCVPGELVSQQVVLPVSGRRGGVSIGDRVVEGLTKATSAQPFSRLFQALPDQPPVLVIAKRADRFPRALEVFTSPIEIAQLAMTLTQVQVQRRV